MQEYERAMLTSFSSGEYTPVGYISFIQVRRITDHSIELTWYPGAYYRFHEVEISLPRDQFVTCVGCSRYSERPQFFAKSSWLEHLFLRQYSVFGIVDAIGVKEALDRGELTRNKLVELRNAVDQVAEKYLDVSFISFADSLLLKSNWTVGTFMSEKSYTYEPEILIEVIKHIRKVYNDILELDIYAILTQGSNEYYEDPLTHISESENHICLNSLGIPFAQLFEIDKAARCAIKLGVHNKSELYMEENFFHSLNRRHGWDRDSLEKNTFYNKMTHSDRNYFCIMWEQLLENLKPSSDNDQ